MGGFLVSECRRQTRVLLGFGLIECERHVPKYGQGFPRGRLTLFVSLLALSFALASLRGDSVSEPGGAKVSNTTRPILAPGRPASGGNFID